MAIFKTKQEAEEKLKSMAQLGKLLEVREVGEGWALKKIIVEPTAQQPEAIPPKQTKTPAVMKCSPTDLDRPMTKAEKITAGRKLCESTWWT
jgi:hypothetical protein